MTMIGTEGGAIELTYCNDDVEIRLKSIYPAAYAKGHCPTHAFGIFHDGVEIGYLNFRIGMGTHLECYAGQIGYGIDEEHRGNRFASKALRAVLPHCFQYFPEVYVTCDPDNYASAKTIESVPHRFLGIVTIPKSNPMYWRGDREKRRYALVQED